MEDGKKRFDYHDDIYALSYGTKINTPRTLESARKDNRLWFCKTMFPEFKLEPDEIRAAYKGKLFLRN